MNAYERRLLIRAERLVLIYDELSDAERAAADELFARVLDAS